MGKALNLTFLFAVKYLYLLCSCEAIIWKVIIGPLHLGYIPSKKSLYAIHAVSYLYYCNAQKHAHLEQQKLKIQNIQNLSNT